MSKEEKELMDAVYNINCDIDERFDETGEELQHLCIKTDGFTFRVRFLDFEIFNSDNDNREYDDEKEEYINSIEDHIRKCMLDVINGINDTINVLVIKNLSKNLKKE